MKIAFPVMDNKGLDGALAGHFGRAPKFTIYDNETKAVHVIDNTGDHFGGSKSTPQILKDASVDLLICNGLGRKAIVLFSELQIGVCITANQFVKDAIIEYNEGKLSPANEEDGCAGQHGDHHH